MFAENVWAPRHYIASTRGRAMAATVALRRNARVVSVVRTSAVYVSRVSAAYLQPPAASAQRIHPTTALISFGHGRVRPFASARSIAKARTRARRRRREATHSRWCRRSSATPVSPVAAGAAGACVAGSHAEACRRLSARTAHTEGAAVTANDASTVRKSLRTGTHTKGHTSTQRTHARTHKQQSKHAEQNQASKQTNKSAAELACSGVAQSPTWSRVDGSPEALRSAATGSARKHESAVRFIESTQPRARACRMACN